MKPESSNIYVLDFKTSKLNDPCPQPVFFSSFFFNNPICSSELCLCSAGRFLQRGGKRTVHSYLIMTNASFLHYIIVIFYYWRLIKMVMGRVGASQVESSILCMSLPTISSGLGFFAPVSIELCSITETLESQVAGMCTIDFFHCGSQQWLFAPQHTAPQEEAGRTHWNTIASQTKRGLPRSALPHCQNSCCHWSHSDTVGSGHGDTVKLDLFSASFLF